MFSRVLFAPEGEGASGGGGGIPAAAPAVAPPATTAPATAPAATAPSATAAPTQPDPATDPNWFKPRLEHERRAGSEAILRELGVTDVSVAKEAIAAAQAAAEARKSAEQRALEASQKLTAEQTEAARLRSITQEHAARMIGVLTAEQQAAVRAIAGDNDPAGQLHAINVLGPTWAKAAAESAAAKDDEVTISDTELAELESQVATLKAARAGRAVPGATTAPAATAPASGATTSPPDHKTAYRAARERNPFAAAAYGLQHAGEVYRTKS